VFKLILTIGGVVAGILYFALRLNGWLSLGIGVVVIVVVCVLVIKHVELDKLDDKKVKGGERNMRNNMITPPCPTCGKTYTVVCASGKLGFEAHDKLIYETGHTYRHCTDCDQVFPHPDSYLPPSMR